jgi:dTDP-4-amino-4,6-dideoxygalactose transaminase
MNLLLDTDIVMDICIPETQCQRQAKMVVNEYMNKGYRIWLYAGHLSLYLRMLRDTLKEHAKNDTPYDEACRSAKEILAQCTKDKHWLPSLSHDCDVLASKRPEQEMLVRATERFPDNTIKILTRDPELLTAYPEITISIEDNHTHHHHIDQTPFIDLASQQDRIRPDLEHNIHTVLHHGRYIMGPEVQKLEKELAEYGGVKHCLGVSSGTDALLIPLMAWGIGPGDAVFTTPFTFIATAEVIQLLGATPVFVDIDPHTFNIDPVKLEEAIKAVKNRDRSAYPLPHSASNLIPKAIIPVDLFGLPAEYDKIMDIALKYDLMVLTDSAQGFGGKRNGKMSISAGHVAATSFFPAKPFGCYGDGGAVFTNDAETAETMESIRIHGKGKDKYDNIRTGINGRLDTIQAAVMLAKLPVFQDEIEKKQKVAQTYTQLVQQKAPYLSPPHIPDGCQSAWAQYSLLAQNRKQRDTLCSALRQAGIPVMIYYPTPLHLQTAFSGLKHQSGDFPTAENIADRIFSLPMHAYLDAHTQEFIISVLAENSTHVE